MKVECDSLIVSDSKKDVALVVPESSNLSGPEVLNSHGRWETDMLRQPRRAF